MTSRELVNIEGRKDPTVPLVCDLFPKGGRILARGDGYRAGKVARWQQSAEKAQNTEDTF